MTRVGCITWRALRVLLCTLLVGTLPGAWTALETAGQISDRGRPLSESGTLELLRERMAQSAASAGAIMLEGPVDPDTYQVGPGDVFHIGIAGLQSMSLPLTVTADGHLTLPDAGTVFVSGLSLAQAKETILEQMKSAYRNVMVTATLAQPRRFYVHVVGAVTAPGRYAVMPVGRVLDAVSLAFADTTRPPTSNRQYRPSFRNVLITGPTGDVRSADLLRYLITGDTRYNPYLRDGDVIQVPAYDPAASSIFINGDVPFAGTYEFSAGDKVSDLLTLGTGRTDLADQYRLIRITRRNPDGSVTEVPGVEDVESEDFGSLSLRPLDQVYVRRESDAERGVVFAHGEVRFPGLYPIEKGKTTLLELVDAAGGFREEALLRAAYLERRAAGSLTDVPTRFVGFSTGPGLPPIFLPDTSAVLRRIRLSPMDWRGTNYFLRELRTERRMALNLAEATGDEMAQVELVDGDRLVVPRDEKAILVFGQVQRAGFVPFEPDRTVGHYLGKAGGKAELAADVYLVEAGTGSYRKGEIAIVRPGDMIFVDSREYLADTAELSRLAMEEKRIEADQKFRTTQIILQTVGSVASIIALIISVSRR